MMYNSMNVLVLSLKVPYVHYPTPQPPYFQKKMKKNVGYSLLCVNNKQTPPYPSLYLLFISNKAGGGCVLD